MRSDVLEAIGAEGPDYEINSVVDEDCNVCAYVAKGGLDNSADGSLLNPFGTIQAAINYAAGHAIPRVCAPANGAAL